MKLMLSADGLKRIVSLSFKANPSYSPNPSMKNYLIESNDKEVAIYFFTGEYEVEAVVPNEEVLKKEEYGSVQVEAETFRKIVASSDMYVSLETKGNTLLVSTDRADYALLTMDSSSFVHFASNTDTELSVVMKAEDFTRAFGKVAYAVSPKYPNELLRGVCIDYKGGSSLTLVGTDSFQLASCECACEKGTRGFRSVVPIDSLKAVASVARNALEMRVGASCAIFASDNYTIVSRIYNGNYPNVSSIVNCSDSGYVNFSVPELLSSLNRMAIINDSVVTLGIEKGVVTLCAVSTTNGTGKEKVEGARVSGSIDGLQTSFNAVYLANALKATGSERIDIRFTDSHHPMLFGGNNPLGEVHILSMIRTR